MRKFRRYQSDVSIEILAEHAEIQAPQPLHNVSYGGLACHSDKPFQPGVPIKVRISGIRQPFVGDGVVVWCDPTPNGFDIGIQFQEGREAFAARMVAQICQIEDYRKKVLETEGRKLSGDAAAMEWIAKHAHEKEVEARAFIRHPIDIPIEIIPQSIEQTHGSKLRNFSLDGASFISAIPLKPGAYVRVRMPGIEDDSDDTIEGCVIWCATKGEQYEVGVKFREIDQAFYSEMLSQVCQIEEYREKVMRTEGRHLSGEEAVKEYRTQLTRRHDPMEK